VPRKTKADLSSVRLKLDRAEHHIKTFSDDLETFCKRDPAPFGFRPEDTPGPNHSVEYVLYAIVREPPPRELALPIGDALQNMRSALEYLAYELSSPKMKRSNKTAFPIFSDECQFKVRGVPKIKSMGTDEQTLIERVQPYAASKIPSNDPLAILRKLSNLDKHQLLVPVIAAVSLRDSWVASDNADIRFTYIARGPVKHDAKIVAFTARPKDPALDMHVEPQSGLQIEISDTGIVGFDLSALELLEMILFHIRFTVIDMWFERSFMPLTWAEVEAAATEKPAQSGPP
jgi:hypothetical protein